jgi:protein-S-isoprenylcysteine O-methyltransferase Ste14
MNLLELLKDSPLLSQPPLAIAANVVTFFAFVLVAAAVVADFKAYHHQNKLVAKSDRSFVETGSMTAFFVAYYVVLKLQLGVFVASDALRQVMIIAGLIVVVVGAAFNVWGRVVLKSRWANQIKIYEDHTLATTGPYAIVRHPLYASLIWMCLGGALVYANALSLVLTVGVFIPMMYIRGKKEDVLLLEAFEDQFVEFRAKTGMFFPRVWG